MVRWLSPLFCCQDACGLDISLGLGYRD
jgi:hypothetical protein